MAIAIDSEGRNCSCLTSRYRDPMLVIESVFGLQIEGGSSCREDWRCTR